MQSVTIEGQLDESLLKQQLVQKFLGKKVIVTIIELEETTTAALPDQREWKHLGSVDLEGRMDQINIRDFAHD